MRNLLKYGLIAACLGTACVALLRAQPQKLMAVPSTDCAKWVERCLRDFGSIKPGMTRAEIERKLRLDGGLQGVSPVRYAHPACGCFKIDVQFDHKRDTAHQDRAIPSEQDKAIRVSKPYIERAFMD